MKERPIIFSAESIQAILDHLKTQTRRAVGKGRWNLPRGLCISSNGMPYSSFYGKKAEDHCPYGQPGDRLWVRETWDFVEWHKSDVVVLYAADDQQSRPIQTPKDWNPKIYDYQGWRSPIHMPRWASRITLEIVNIHAERLQDISKDDARAEGFPYPLYGTGSDPILWFLRLWDSINAKRGYPWKSNPWVWAIDFRMVTELKDK